ncbi:acyl carrier protein [Actinokineospora enzanensis]|uniref:acyl carrier protein n=1 Tax=Actinokineospora enzanensis TaxID=155975 RepID=UPI000376BCAC|nr:acyl carrier protein [Actinokineospora enzanensis]
MTLPNPTDQAEKSENADPAAVVREIVVGVAGVEVRPDESFFDLGLDSIQLMQICNDINERYGEVIDLFLLFENPTINDCVAVVASRSAS